MADNQRRATAGDMVRSLAVIMIPILLITWLLTSEPKDYQVKPVDYKPLLATARAEAGWPVMAPIGLPESGENAWIANVASWTRNGQSTESGPSPRNEWQLGMLSPDQVHYSLTQADGNTTDLVAQKSREGRPIGGEPTIKGQSWQQLESPDGRTRTLVSRDDKSTVILVADTDFLTLQQFAGTLSDR